MEMGLADVTLVVYHPDKQRDQARRLAAQNRFTAIQRAYEGRFTEALHEDLTLAVLTDPQKRAVYDMFGEEGLRTNWEVGPRLKTPEEVSFSTDQAADYVATRTLPTSSIREEAVGRRAAGQVQGWYAS